jgi:hypothetical protein
MTHPTALADQLRAASNDAHQRLRRAAHLPQLRFTPDPPVPPWLTDLFQRHADALLAGRGSVCPHVGSSPRVVCAFAWTPGLLVCPGCRHLATPDEAEDTTCDRCRTNVAQLWPGIAQLGPILFAYGLCNTCHTSAR